VYPARDGGRVYPGWYREGIHQLGIGEAYREVYYPAQRPLSPSLTLPRGLFLSSLTLPRGFF